jgi:hypothetical protein
VRRHLALAASAALAFVACQDVCQRAEAVANDFAKKSCGSGSTMPFDVVTCQASLAHCTNRDLAALQDWYDCLERLPTCTEATSATFSAQVLGCAGHMAQLSTGCFRQPGP